MGTRTYRWLCGAIIGGAVLPILAGCDVAGDPATGSADGRRDTETGAAVRSDLSSAPGSSAHGASDPHKQLSPSQHVKVALQHNSEGRLSMAIDTLTGALDRYANHPLLLTVRGSLYLQARQYSAALKDMNIALKNAPGDPSLLINRARVYSQFGRLDDALADLNRAIAGAPRLVAGYFNRGTIYYQQGRYGAARDDFDRCISIDPHTAGPYFNRAATLDLLGDSAAAITDMRHFIELTDNPGWKRKAEELLSLWQRAAEPGDGGAEGQAKTNS